MSEPSCFHHWHVPYYIPSTLPTDRRVLPIGYRWRYLRWWCAPCTTSVALFVNTATLALSKLGTTPSCNKLAVYEFSNERPALAIERGTRYVSYHHQNLFGVIQPGFHFLSPFKARITRFAISRSPVVTCLFKEHRRDCYRL